MDFASLKKFVVGENLKIGQSKASFLQRGDALKDKSTERRTLKNNFQQDGWGRMAVNTFKELQIPWLHRQLEERTWTCQLLYVSSRNAKLQGFQRDMRVLEKQGEKILNLAVDCKPCRGKLHHRKQETQNSFVIQLPLHQTRKHKRRAKDADEAV